MGITVSRSAEDELSSSNHKNNPNEGLEDIESFHTQFQPLQGLIPAITKDEQVPTREEEPLQGLMPAAPIDEQVPTREEEETSCKNASSDETYDIYCEADHSKDNGQPLKCIIQRSGGATSEQMTLKDQEFQPPSPSKEGSKESITPETLFTEHILKGAHVSHCPCAAIVSGTEKCEKKGALMLFLSRAIHTKDSKPVSPLIEDPHADSGMECIACNRVIILGSRPFEKLTWLMSTTDADDAVVCLLSYLAKLCKTRNPSSQGEYIRLLEFVPLPATSEGIGVSDPKVGDQLKLLYSKLRERWEWLEKDENARAVVPTGVCLLNIFDIGDSKAAQDFCPILSKYCRRSVHVACYSGTRDAEVLKKELAKENDQHYFQSTKCKLLKQMSGCTHNEQIVTLAAIDMGFINQTTQHEVELAESFQKMLGIEKIHHLGIHQDLIESTKTSLEKSVMSASFYEETPLRYMLLLHRMRQECTSFWLKRCDIESFSKGYNFENGDLEKFLQLFSSFGDIFYANDIPSLRGYVVVNIVRFVKHIHSLYNTNHEATKYGLFRWREEED